MTIRQHVFMYDATGIGCRTCPLPRRNTRVHIDPADISTPDISEPTHAAPETTPARTQPTQLTLPKPRKPREARKAARRASRA